MNPGSIRFKLCAWFAGLLLVVMLLFGAYTYARLERFLVEVQRAALAHRVQQIAAMLQESPRTGEDYVATQIEARFAPELNDKFVRVTRPDGSTLYLAGAPNDRSFDPAVVPKLENTEVLTARLQGAAFDGGLLVAVQKVTVGAGSYIVEVGVALGGSYRVLHALLLTLAAGLPVVMAIAVLGGYVVIRRALDPVQNMMQAAQDITLRHLSRRLPVPESGDEIASLALALNQMIARLDESFQNTSRFTADASHELRTPLTIIRGELEALLLPMDLRPQTQQALASLLEEVERLVRIVEGLFALSRLDTGEAQTERVRIDLAKLAETTLEQMCLLAEEKKIALTCDTQERVEVEGDRARLKQVVVNLLDNAIKYTPAGGKISLQVRHVDSAAILEVSDSGPGVSATALPHLFERFYRAEEARATEGAGLGLSIVRSICAAHGGAVTLDNISPTGCRAKVELPRAR